MSPYFQSNVGAVFAEDLPAKHAKGREKWNCPKSVERVLGISARWNGNRLAHSPSSFSRSFACFAGESSYPVVALISCKAVRAWSISCAVVKAPMLMRTVPPLESVPSARCISGAQCKPARTWMP